MLNLIITITQIHRVQSSVSHLHHVPQALSVRQRRLSQLNGHGDRVPHSRAQCRRDLCLPGFCHAVDSKFPYDAVNGCSYKGGDFKILRTQLDCSWRLDHHRLDRKVQVGLGIKVVSLVMVMVGCEHDHGSGEIILLKRIPLAFELALL